MLRFCSQGMFFLAVVFIAGALALAVAGFQMSGEAVAVNAVSIGDNFFAPQSIAVTAGTAVEWRNDGALPHTTTSDSAVWDSGMVKNGQTFSQVFPTPGTFTYNCAFHPEMTGTVVVEAAAGTPTPAPTPTQAPTQAPTGSNAGSQPPAGQQGSGGAQPAAAGALSMPIGGGPPPLQGDMFRGAIVLGILGVALAGGGATLTFASLRAGRDRA